MNPEYADIFQQRGRSYHDAMRAYPNVRGYEFDTLFAMRPLQQGEKIVDIPSGGGYLARRLDAQTEVVPLEITSGFGVDTTLVNPEDLSIFVGFDRAVCLAALHHFEDAFGFLGKVRSTLKPSGILHIADIAAGSPLCEFLDDFVGHYNLTGHAGRYLPADAAAYESLGRVIRCKEIICPWQFSNEVDMLAFCGGLFGLFDFSTGDLREALRKWVGYRNTATGIELDWRLLYIDVIV